LTERPFDDNMGKYLKLKEFKICQNTYVKDAARLPQKTFIVVIMQRANVKNVIPWKFTSTKD